MKRAATIASGMTSRIDAESPTATKLAANVVDFDSERAAEEAVRASPDFSEDETALAFADRRHQFLRFDHSTGNWYVYEIGRAHV